MSTRIQGFFLLTGTLFISAPAGAQKRVIYADYLGGGTPSPVFINGYLFQMQPAGGMMPAQGLALYGPTGKLAFLVNVSAPDGTPARLLQSGVAVDSDGTVALAMWYGACCSPPRAKGGAVVFLNQQGTQTRFVDTGRYLPDALTFGPDHSIWTIGTQFRPDMGGSDKEFWLVRHFSPAGTPIGEFLPRSSFRPGLSPGASGLSFMRTAADRVGIMTYPGMVGDTPTWIELDFDGKLIGRWNVKSDFNIPNGYAGSYAFTADGRLYAQAFNPEFHEQTLWIFDRTTASWKATTGGPDKRSWLVGSDAENLVFKNPTHSYSDGRPMVWFSAP